MGKKNIYWVLPAPPKNSGGPIVAEKISNILNTSDILTSEVVLTEPQNSTDYRSIEKILSMPAEHLRSSIFVVTYGPLVNEHIRLIRNSTKTPIFYYAQSFGWKTFRSSIFGNKYTLSKGVDIICVSRYVMGHWNSHLQTHRVAHIPPPINDAFKLTNQVRDIDVLVHLRKQSQYCKTELLPLLKSKKIKVVEIDQWLSPEELGHLLNRTKIFLYHTSLFMQSHPRYPICEGFGLPPLEALLCGSRVATDCLGGVNDYLDHSNCTKLLGNNKIDDADSILEGINSFEVNVETTRLLAAHYCDSHFYIKKWESLILKWYS